MGIGSSSQTALQGPAVEHLSAAIGDDSVLGELARIAGQYPLPESNSDGFNATLRSLLSTPLFFPLPPPDVLRERVATVCVHLAANDGRTHNFAKVVSHLLWLLDMLKSAKDVGIEDLHTHLHETLNVLVLVKVFTVFLVESHGHPANHLLPPETVSANAEHHSLPPTQPRESSLFYDFVRGLAEFILHPEMLSGPVAALEATVRSECIRTLIALLSSQMCSRSEGEEPAGIPLYDHSSFLVTSALAGQLHDSSPSSVASPQSLVDPLVFRLLHNFAYLSPNSSFAAKVVDLQPAPASSPSDTPSGSSANLEAGMPSPPAGGLIFAILRLPLSAYEYLTSFIYRGSTAISKEQQNAELKLIMESQSNLRESSLSLLLLLIHPYPSPLGDAPTNPFRKALNSLKDDGGSALPEQRSGRIDFAKVYDGITRDGAISDSLVLLLYFMLQGNNNFLQYVLARTDCETLLLPMLQNLYESVDQVEDWFKQQGIYMVVITLLMLSRDATLAQNLHFVRVRGVWWYKEHYLTECTLGGLLVLVLVRVIQANLRKSRDPYLHSNCLAILANASQHIVDLPSFPSFRLVKLVEMILSRCGSLKRESQEEEEASGGAVAQHEATTYTGFLQTVLRIISSILTHGLDKNPHVVYALLQQKNVFLPLAERQTEYGKSAGVVAQVISFFEKEVEEKQKQQPTEGELSVDEILEVIQAKTTQCKSTLKLRPEKVEYKYEEEEGSSAHEFFSPFVWSLIYHTAPGIMWSPKAISLFVVQPTEVQFEQQQFTQFNQLALSK